MEDCVVLREPYWTNDVRFDFGKRSSLMPDRTDSERDLFWKRAVLARLYTAFIKERTMILLAAVLAAGRADREG